MVPKDKEYVYLPRVDGLLQQHAALLAVHPWRQAGMVVQVPHQPDIAPEQRVLDQLRPVERAAPRRQPAEQEGGSQGLTAQPGDTVGRGSLGVEHRARASFVIMHAAVRHTG